MDPEDRPGGVEGLLGSKPLPGLGVAARSQTGRNAARLGKCCSPPSTVSRAKRAVSGRRFRELGWVLMEQPLHKEKDGHVVIFSVRSRTDD